MCTIGGNSGDICLLPTTRNSLLIRLVDPRDDAAWNEFVGLYESLIYRIARSQGLQDADACDVSQEVLRSVARAVPRWVPDPARGSFRGWLFRVARNATLDWLAKRRLEPQGSGDTSLHLLLAERPAPDPTTARVVMAEFRQELFAWAARQVEPEFQPAHWQAFWQTAVVGRSAKEVGRELAMSVGAVYVARCRVTARLREFIAQVDADAVFDSDLE